MAGPGQIGGPSKTTPGEFADDQVAQQRGSKKNAKESQRETLKKAGSKKSALLQKVHETSFRREPTEKVKTSSKTDEKELRIQRDPKESSKKHQVPTARVMGSAAKQIGAIAQLLSQLAEAINEADVIANSFVDDGIVAQKNSQKESKKRAAKQRQAEDAKANANEDLKKLSESTQTQSDSQEEPALTNVTEWLSDSSSGASGNKEAVALRSLALGLLGDGSTSEDLVRALHNKAAALIELSESLDAEIDRSGLDGAVDNLREVTSLVEQAHQKFKGLLIPVLSGELGPLRRDPYDQFQGLFEQVESWPETIPPGKTCEKTDLGETTWTQEDWDDFISWLIAPSTPPGELQSAYELLSLVSK